jgi:hypothetical protein
MPKTIRNVERGILKALKSRYADPDVEVPLALREQPTQIVFTALQPKQRYDSRKTAPMSAMMGALGGSNGFGNPFADPLGGLPELGAPAEPAPRQSAQDLLVMDDERI